MERRREPRFESGQQVEVHILGREPAVLTGRIDDISGRGMRLLLDRPVPADAALMIKTGAAALLAEARYSEPAPDGYAIGLALDQVLYQSLELQALNRAILGLPAPARKPAKTSAGRASHPAR